MKQSSDPKDALFIVNFSCLVLTGEGDDTREHELTTCIVRAKTKKHAEQWGLALRHKFVNDEPETGPSIDEEAQVDVQVEAFSDYVETLFKNGLTLEKDN